jgi:hypothetical protein
LKKLFQETDQKELINLLHDLYKNSVENRRFITARYVKAGDENKILEAYRKKVINVYYHPRGAASMPRYSVAKKLSTTILRLPEILRGQWTWHLPL